MFKARRALSRFRKDDDAEVSRPQLTDKSEELIDVKSLLAELSVEEANRLAEEYFQRVTDWNFHLSKPFGAFEETPQLLINFAVILQGLSLCKGMTVLEFGAGTGACPASPEVSVGCVLVCWALSLSSKRLRSLSTSVSAVTIADSRRWRLD